MSVRSADRLVCIAMQRGRCLSTVAPPHLVRLEQRVVVAVDAEVLNGASVLSRVITQTEEELALLDALDAAQHWQSFAVSHRSGSRNTRPYRQLRNMKGWVSETFVVES